MKKEKASDKFRDEISKFEEKAADFIHDYYYQCVDEFVADDCNIQIDFNKGGRILFRFWTTKETEDSLQIDSEIPLEALIARDIRFAKVHSGIGDDEVKRILDKFDEMTKRLRVEFFGEQVEKELGL